MQVESGSALRRTAPIGIGLAVAWAAAAITIALQIAYPLLDGGGHDRALRLVTIGAVVSFAAASSFHAGATRGASAGFRVVLVAGACGLAAEAIGVRTDFPFGAYAYADTLGPQLLGVPMVVPLAWLMMAYPCLLLGRRLGGGSATRAVLIGTWTLTAWDLFLDPQMVAAGHWAFDDPTPGLPGTHGVPLTNLAGWLLVSVIMMTALQSVVSPPRDGPREGVIAVLLGWTWVGSAMAAAAFFGRPVTALWGGVCLGLPVGAYLLALLRGRRGADRRLITTTFTSAH